MTPPEPNANEQEQQPCSACRGTGKLISGLGGKPHQVTCPWCEGSGHFLQDHNAQDVISEKNSPSSE